TPKPASTTPADESPLTSGASGCAEPLSPALAADADKARPGPGDTADSVPGGPAPIRTLLNHTAEKLSARSEGLIFYAIGRHEESGELFLKITGNQGGGLHSKEWIALSAIDDVLRSLPADKPFKSSVMKRLFKGGSANNAGFLSAILRSDGLKLVQKADGNPMLHELVPDYLERWGSLTNELCTVTSTIE
ncbi:TPA: hypothetical protein I8220_004505, partial [Aeromonas hydrophila]|nr:hypothetical protein [Aeromonas hydrophila]HAT2497569.1 hypothetical protein [Aeromonas hydrophila]HAT2511653.1 hypothetical protein [Aeromonas hydrophila]HAT2533277.1 hypothetical protein [Aeromonas hydrophila]